jgi:hypothetical protein
VLPADIHGQGWAAVGRCASIVGALGVLYGILPFQGDRWWIGAIVGLAGVAAVIPVTIRRVRAVFRSSHPVSDAIEALTLLVALLVFSFSALYLGLDRNGDQFAGLDTRIDSLYFSVTTLATVGYGDIHATGQVGRVAVTVQMILNLSVLAIAVRLLTAAVSRALKPEA